MAKNTAPKKQNYTKKLDHLKADFISVVSHELRTPLSIIKEAINLVNDQIVGKLTKEQIDILNIAVVNTRRLERLVHDLLDLSRLDSGRAKLHMKRVVPSYFIDEAVRHFQEKAQNQGKKIITHIPQDLPEMYADEDTLMQVLNNLIENAINYAKEVVEVEARFDHEIKKDTAEEKSLDAGVHICVKDDGRGIAKKDMNKIFKRFTQINRPVGGSGYKGTGLGLVISKEIVQLHNGKIWVKSAIGKGAQFHVLIPAYQTEGDLRYYLGRMLDAAQESKTSLALFMIQINNLSELDQNFSTVDIMRALEHHIGTQALRSSDDVHYHIDSDHLVVLAKASKVGAHAMLNRIKKSLSHYRYHASDRLIKLSLSLGLAMFPENEIDPEKLLDAAIRQANIISDPR